MLRRIVILFVVVFLLNSCSQAEPYWYCLGLCNPAVGTDSINMNAKDGPGTTEFSKNKKMKMILDVLNRPVNKKVTYGGTTILIPEGTKLNDRKNRYSNNIIDEKTGLGLPVYFENRTDITSSVGYCSHFEMYCKIIDNNSMVIIEAVSYENEKVNQLYKKIIEKNGFKKYKRK